MKDNDSTIKTIAMITANINIASHSKYLVIFFWLFSTIGLISYFNVKIFISKGELFIVKYKIYIKLKENNK